MNEPSASRTAHTPLKSEEWFASLIGVAWVKKVQIAKKETL